MKFRSLILLTLSFFVTMTILGCGSSSNPSSVNGGLSVNAVTIAAGGSHTVALKSDGTVWAWGDDSYGQIGDGNKFTFEATSKMVQGFSGVTAIAAGASHSVALKSNGTVWTLGSDNQAQLGNTATAGSFSTTPVQVAGLSGVTAIAVGEGARHTVALESNGTVWAWGDDSNGQLGNGTATSAYNSIPMQVQGLSGMTAIAVGGSHTVALKGDGTVWAWGSNSNGQLGDGTTSDHYTTIQVTGLKSIIAIAGGAYHTLALKADGTVWAWGSNSNGQLGDGTSTERHTPVQVNGLSGVIAIAAGGEHTVSLSSDGTVWAWGSNSNGQLGDGTTSDHYIPVQVSGLSSIAAIAAGGKFTVARGKDGTIWTWGYNNYGQLGDGTTTTRITPFHVLVL